jgi:hypothetical protein
VSSPDTRHGPCAPSVRHTRWTTPSTTPDEDDRYRRVRVTHLFHPLFGRDFEFVIHRRNWGRTGSIAGPRMAGCSPFPQAGPTWWARTRSRLSRRAGARSASMACSGWPPWWTGCAPSRTAIGVSRGLRRERQPNYAVMMVERWGYSTGLRLVFLVFEKLLRAGRRVGAVAVTSRRQN